MTHDRCSESGFEVLLSSFFAFVSFLIILSVGDLFAHACCTALCSVVIQKMSKDSIFVDKKAITSDTCLGQHGLSPLTENRTHVFRAGACLVYA